MATHSCLFLLFLWSRSALKVVWKCLHVCSILCFFSFPLPLGPASSSLSLFSSVCVQFSSVALSCPTLWDPVDCSTPGFPVHHQLPEPTQTQVHQIGDAIYFILCRPLLLPPSIFPRIRVFSNESVLWIRWPKYWSFSFSISPSSEYSALIFFRIDWLGLLAVQGMHHWLHD